MSLVGQATSPRDPPTSGDPFSELIDLVGGIKLEPSGRTVPTPLGRSQEARDREWCIRGLPWMMRLSEEVPEATEAAQQVAIDEEIGAFIDWIRPRQWEHQLRQEILGCFNKLVNKVWPTAKVYPFGSFKTGVYMPDSDFDIVISDANLSALPPHTYFSLLRSALTTSGFADRNSIKTITNARVPLIKFKSSSEFGSFRFDVSFSSGGKMNGPEGATVSLRLLAELEDRGERRRERAETLIWIIKNMLENQRLHEVKHGGLGGFSVLCLCVWFMQVDRKKSDRHSPVWDLISLFQAFVLKFDLRTVALCTANGGCTLSKKDWGWQSQREPDKLSIQHPVVLERDLSSGSYKWNEIRRLFQKNFDVLAQAMLRPQQTDKRESILKKLGLLVPVEVIARRASRQDLFTSERFKGIVDKWEPKVLVDSRGPLFSARRQQNQTSQYQQHQFSPPVSSSQFAFQNLASPPLYYSTPTSLYTVPQFYPSPLYAPAQYQSHLRSNLSSPSSLQSPASTSAGWPSPDRPAQLPAPPLNPPRPPVQRP
ncbi:hypothetical protein JCM3765_003358 [Sporobolomyces pararoseus]